MRLISFCLASSALSSDEVKSNGSSITVATENEIPLAENADQIIQDQLYWCCRDNKSLSSCANDVVRTLNSYLYDDFACSVTSTSPAYAWKTYEGSQDMSNCFLYMNCGHDGRASPNFRTFDSACTGASYACGSDYACARDYIVRNHNNGQFKWCPNSFNVLINPNPGAAAFKSSSGGVSTSIGSIYCTGFCVN